jgi:hypothetical protein
VVIEAKHGKGILSNCRIVRIRKGKVPCVSITTFKPRKCSFKRKSGRWLTGKAGRKYALVGDAVSPKGRRGGNYVIAAPIGKKRSSPCGKLPQSKRASSSDAAGTPAGEELAGACTVEVLSSPYNRSGRPLLNYATREVCTSSYPHPDGATLSSNPAPGVYCYKGQGAGLNDINGTERNASDRYLTGTISCHTAWAGGYEIAAAKRPATVNYPAPAKVNPKTPLLWRPVAAGVKIAN